MQCPYFRSLYTCYVAGKVCSVLIKEMSLFQVVYTHLYVAGKVCSALRKCPYFRGSLYTSLCSWEGVQYPH